MGVSTSWSLACLVVSGSPRNSYYNNVSREKPWWGHFDFDPRPVDPISKIPNFLLYSALQGGRLPQK